MQKTILAFILVASIATDCTSDQYCRSCVSSSCSYCVQSFLVPGASSCTPTQTFVDNCVGYASSGVCSRCKLGFYVDSVGKCIAITIANCVEVNTDKNLCLTCSQGILEKNGQCSTSNKCATTNCKYCYNFLGQEYCNVCMPGYLVYKVDQSPPICKLQADDFTKNCDSAVDITLLSTKTCLTCSPGFYHTGKLCITSAAVPSVEFSSLKSAVVFFVLLLTFI